MQPINRQSAPPAPGHRAGQSPKRQMETAAIVLDYQDHGESDKIITFFCERLGRLTGIAKGAKRSKKRFVNKLEIFSSLIIRHTLPQNNQLAFIAEADLLDSFLSIRTNYLCFTRATIIREIVLLATKEQGGDDDLYPLLHWALSNLNTLSGADATLILFLTRFFANIGYRPNLTTCIRCGKELGKNRTFFFCVEDGGVLCNNCQNKSRNNIPLSCGTLRSLDMALKEPLSRLHRLKLTQQNYKEAIVFFSMYAKELFQREIVSWQFLPS